MGAHLVSTFRCALWDNLLQNLHGVSLDQSYLGSFFLLGAPLSQDDSLNADIIRCVRRELGVSYQHHRKLATGTDIQDGCTIDITWERSVEAVYELRWALAIFAHARMHLGEQVQLKVPHLGAAVLRNDGDDRIDAFFPCSVPRRPSQTHLVSRLRL